VVIADMIKPPLYNICNQPNEINGKYTINLYNELIYIHMIDLIKVIEVRFPDVNKAKEYSDNMSMNIDEVKKSKQYKIASEYFTLKLKAIASMEHIVRVDPDTLTSKSYINDNSKLDDVCKYINDQYNDGTEIWLTLIDKYGEEHIDNVLDYVEIINNK